MPDFPAPESHPQLRKFEEACRTGQRPRIEDYLAQIAANELPNLLPQFVQADAFYRFASGEIPRPADYHSRFRDAEPGKITAAVETARFRWEPSTASHGSSPTRAGEADSVPPSGPRHVACPQCHNPIPVASRLPRELTCEACGSSFRLEDFQQPTTRQLEIRVLGRFQLLEEVGKGSFGTVWRARDTELQRIVAVKIPHASLIDSANYRERFLREARAAAQLSHPGIVRLYDVPVVDGVPILVSDLIDGVPLRELLHSGRPPFRVAASLAADVADALAYAHGRKLVHRDIKPGNIIVRFPERADPPASASGSGLWGQPIIVDFGLALRDEAEIVMTVDGQVIGTPAYMSPEQAGGHAHAADGRSDIFSLGVVLYEMLCGELPFRGSKAMILHQVLHDEPRPPRKLNDRIPRDLETICLKAMAKQPAWRYQTGEEMAADLRSFLNGEPIRARPVGELERLWRWCRRNRLVSGLLGAVALSLVAGTSVSLFFAVRAAERARQAIASGKAAEAAAVRAQNAENLMAHQWYHAKIALINRDWSDGRVDWILQRLSEVERASVGDLRGFEWYYFHRLCRLDLQTFNGTGDEALAIACDPSGRLIAAGTLDGRVQLCDLRAPSQVRILYGHKRAVTDLIFHPDGRRLITAGHDGTVRIWDVASGVEKTSPFEHQAPVTSMALSADGSRLATATGGASNRDSDRGAWLPGEIRFWDLRSGEQALPTLRDGSSFKRIALSRKGRYLAWLTFQGQAGIRDLEKKETYFPFGKAALWVSCVAFSPDHRVAWAGEDQTVKIWDVQARKELLTFPKRRLPTTYRTISFSADGSRLAGGSTDGDIEIWDANTGVHSLSLFGHSRAVNGIAFTPDGRRLASASADGSLKVWDSVHELDPLTLDGSAGSVFAVTFDPRGRLACAQGGGVTIWDSELEHRDGQIPDRSTTPHSIAFSSDGLIMASGGQGGEVILWDAATAKEIRRLPRHTSLVSGVAFSRDGERVFSASFDHTVKVSDVRTGEELLALPRTGGAVKSLAASSDGRFVAYACSDGTADIWSLEERRVVQTFRGHRGQLRCIAFQPGGSLVASGAADGTVRIWQATTGKEEHTLRGHAGGANALCFSPDGGRLVTSDYGKSVRVWDVVSGEELLSLPTHQGPVSGLAFSPDGFRLATGSTEGAVKVWDATPLTTEILERREARSLVGFLTSKRLSLANMVQRIREDGTISDAVRQKALELAQGGP